LLINPHPDLFQALAMAEFLLFIVVLVLFLEIGPSEMPTTCKSSVQQVSALVDCMTHASVQMSVCVKC
jgi:hypothetical protein